MAMNKTTKTVLIVIAAVAGLGCLCGGGTLLFGGLAMFAVAQEDVAQTARAEGPAADIGDPALIGTWSSSAKTSGTLTRADGSKETKTGVGHTDRLELRRDGTFQQHLVNGSPSECGFSFDLTASGTWKVENATLVTTIEKGQMVTAEGCDPVKSTTKALPPATVTARYALDAAATPPTLTITQDDGKSSTLTREGP